MRLSKNGIMWLVLIFLFALALRSHFYKKRSMLRNMMVAEARITDVNPGKSGCNIFFTYTFNGRNYNDQEKIDMSYQKRHLVLNRIFPVAVNSNNPRHCRLLIMPESFEYLKLPFPDSLNWVLQLR